MAGLLLSAPPRIISAHVCVSNVVCALFTTWPNHITRIVWIVAYNPPWVRLIFLCSSCCDFRASGSHPDGSLEVRDATLLCEFCSLGWDRLYELGRDISLRKSQESGSRVLFYAAHSDIYTSSFSLSDKSCVFRYLGDGRFHLESIMIANPEIPAYR